MLTAHLTCKNAVSLAKRVVDEDILLLPKSLCLTKSIIRSWSRLSPVLSPVFLSGLW